jgi:hypothetical protein
MRKQLDARKALVMAQRPYRLLGLPETRSLIFLIKNSPDQVKDYLDYLQPAINNTTNTNKIANKGNTTIIF